MKRLLAPLGFLLAGLSFPGMMWLEGKRPLPRIPPPELLYACDPALRSFTHCAKDQVMALVRFDVQWWTKAFLFVIVMLVLLNFTQWIIRKRN